jgi:hypothetical protein
MGGLNVTEVIAHNAKQFPNTPPIFCSLLRTLAKWVMEFVQQHAISVFDDYLHCARGDLIRYFAGR